MQFAVGVGTKKTPIYNTSGRFSFFNILDLDRISNIDSNPI